MSLGPIDPPRSARHAASARLAGGWACLIVLAGVPALAAPDDLASASPPAALANDADPVVHPTLPPPLAYRFEALLRSGAGNSARASASRGMNLAVRIDRPVQLRPAAPEPPALFGGYRLALERESRRLLERDPSAFWGPSVDEEGYPLEGVHHEAERIFVGANNRVLSGFVERLVADAAALRSARRYVEGVRLDVRRGGGLDVAGPGASEAGSNTAASFSFVAVGRPRVEMRTVLPGGIKTRVEVGLSSPGARMTLSRGMGQHLRGSLSGGIEDSGADRWLSAGLEIRF